MRNILGWIVTLMLCSAVLLTAACSPPPPPPPRDEWYTYRYDSARTCAQPWASALSDPAKLDTLHVGWTFPIDGQPPVGGFRASPIVVNDTVFIGSTDGRFYALDAATGALKWQYPDSPLLGSCSTWGRYGIQSSATYAKIGGQDAVIFGAPDPDPRADGGQGSARLFALNAQTGQPIWKYDGVHDGSDIVAHVSECTSGSVHHERIAYSSPLVLGNKVYIGIHDAGDDPIQNGKVVAVELNTGHIDNNFRYVSTGTRGGGVWNSAATDGTGVYFTTGNTRCWNGDVNLACQSEPNPNHGLSMIRVEKDTGNIVWAIQPVPYALDEDPDWAAGATVMSTSCGEMIASVQKDGWSYAVNAGNGTPGLPSMLWQFPPTGVPTPQLWMATATPATRAPVRPGTTCSSSPLGARPGPTTILESAMASCMHSMPAL